MAGDEMSLSRNFQHEKPYCESSFLTIPITFSSSINLISKKSAGDFGPSDKPRMISSFYLSVLIKGHILWKDFEMLAVVFR